MLYLEFISFFRDNDFDFDPQDHLDKIFRTHSETIFVPLQSLSYRVWQKYQSRKEDSGYCNQKGKLLLSLNAIPYVLIYVK